MDTQGNSKLQKDKAPWPIMTTRAEGKQVI